MNTFPGRLLRGGTSHLVNLDFVSEEEIDPQLVTDYGKDAVSRYDEFKTTLAESKSRLALTAVLSPRLKRRHDYTRYQWLYVSASSRRFPGRSLTPSTKTWPGSRRR